MSYKANESRENRKTCLTNHTLYITPYHITGYNALGMDTQTDTDTDTDTDMQAKAVLRNQAHGLQVCACLV